MNHQDTTPPAKYPRDKRLDRLLGAYDSLRHGEKVALAIQIRQDVSDHWDEDEPTSYPRELASFDEEVRAVSLRLNSIEWEDNPSAEAPPLEAESDDFWCDCPQIQDYPRFVPDGPCDAEPHRCGETKHHWHCRVCDRVVQVG